MPFDRCRRFDTIRFSSHEVAHASKENCLYTTRDGGRGWKKVYCTSVDSSIGTAPNIESFQFLTPREAWMITLDLLHSRDGGATWSKLDFGSVLPHSVRFYDQSVGYWVGSALAQHSSPERAVVYRTVDGGRTWVESPTGLPPGARLRDAWPVSATEVWAVGDVLVHSTDGGGSWKEVAIDRQWQNLAVHFTSPQVGWMSRKPEDNYLLTIDAGRTWTPRQLPFEHILYIGLVFVDARDAWTAWGSVHRSLDGGVTWSAVLESPGGDDGGRSYYDVQYLEPERLVVATSACQAAFFAM